MLNDRAIARLNAGLCAVLGLCVFVFIVRSMHWPLVNDASWMHYASFLIDKGVVPYRDFLDMNMPGSFLVDWLAVHTFGGGALAWRLFDLALMGVASLAIFAIARPYGWFAGVFGASLLILFHGRDGMGQLGQRDLQMAVLMLVAYAFLFRALRTNLTWPMGFFGLAAGMAAMIKPTALPWSAVLLAMAAATLHRRQLPVAKKVVVGIVGLLLPMILICAWLWRNHAMAACLHSLRLMMPYYAAAGRRSIGYLIRMSMSPSMQVLALAAAVIAWMRRDWRTLEGSALIVGVAFGVASYVLQGKGYAYHRYPLVALLMVWVGIECSRALHDRKILRVVGIAGLVYGCLGVAPLYLRTAIRARWSEVFITSLQRDLITIGGEQLSGQVQCIDSVSGCLTTLYRMRLLQSAGLLSDVLIFGPAEQQIVRDTQTSFWKAIQARPPRVIVVSSWLHLINAGDYKKLAMWPEFASYLSANYDVEIERSFPPNMTGQQGYRVYVLKPLAASRP